MGGFDHLETAMRARDIIKRASREEAGKVLRPKLIGRMMSVDLPRLKGTVWFPGDEQPMPVNIFANAVPAEWQHKRPEFEGEGSSTDGWGATVAVERLNDALWVTHILTGSSSALDFRSLGVSLVEQNGAIIQAGGPTADAIVDIAGDPYETFINCRVTDTSVLVGEAVEFGPFTTFSEGTPGAGYMEITVFNGAAVKVYRFVADPANEFDNVYYSSLNAIWFRLIPEQHINTSTWSGDTATWGDFDLDISFKKTSYGNTEFFSGYKEMWFRLVKRSNDTTGLDARITIRATNVQKGRSLGGRELFMQERVVSPGIVWGYLGYHGANHGLIQTENYTFDVFNRVVAAGWGQSNTQVDYEQSTGTSANAAVDGQRGVIIITSNNSRYDVRQDESKTNFDAQMIVQLGVAATGAPIRMGFVVNFNTANTNCWFLSLVFGTGGTVSAAVEKRVTGVVTSLGTGGSQSYTASSKFRIRIQTMNDGTAQTYRVRMWPVNTREPQTWAVTATETATRAANTWGVYAQADTSNTNTKPLSVYFEDLRANTAYGTVTSNGQGITWHTGPWRSGILRMANDLQKTWTYDGYIEWHEVSSTQYIRWTGNIHLDGIGSHRNGMQNGRAFIRLPTEQAAFDVRIMPVTGGTDVVSCDPTVGIPLAFGQSLWCAVSPECIYDNLVYQLFIVDGQRLADYILPEWMVLIAARGPFPATPEIRLGNGETLDRWHRPTFFNSWADRVGFPPLRYRKFGGAGNMVHITGQVTVGNGTAGVIFATVDPEYRPPSQQVIPAPGGNTVITVDGANIQCQSTMTGGTVVYINGVYAIDAGN
jgi:hypothetical protein